jgi:hypothetical protein
MRIGLFYQIQVPKPWTADSEAQRIYEALEQIPYAEQNKASTASGFPSTTFVRCGRITALLTSRWRR